MPPTPAVETVLVRPVPGKQQETVRLLLAAAQEPTDVLVTPPYIRVPRTVAEDAGLLAPGDDSVAVTADPAPEPPRPSFPDLVPSLPRDQHDGQPLSNTQSVANAVGTPRDVAPTSALPGADAPDPELSAAAQNPGLEARQVPPAANGDVPEFAHAGEPAHLHGLGPDTHPHVSERLHPERDVNRTQGRQAQDERVAGFPSAEPQGSFTPQEGDGIATLAAPAGSPNAVTAKQVEAADAAFGVQPDGSKGDAQVGEAGTEGGEVAASGASEEELAAARAEREAFLADFVRESSIPEIEQALASGEVTKDEVRTAELAGKNRKGVLALTEE